MQDQNKQRKKRLVFTVTNDLNFDQRMIRICSSLENIYNVLLVGRKMKHSNDLIPKSYQQKRLNCFFKKGKFFYIEYNIRLFLFLLFTKMDLICAIDLDTILPCYFISVFRRKKRVYDAHELFCEMKEIVTRPKIYRLWKFIEKHTVPNFKYGYTVNRPIKEIFQKEYSVSYEVIMNVPVLAENYSETTTERFIIYQGSVNEGRSFEILIPAFQWIDCPFYIYGDGNFFEQCQQLIEKYHLQSKVFLKGKLLPEELKRQTKKALLGVTLFENNGLSNYYSLGNRFFDYIHAGIPQLCVNYPAYKEINEQFEIALLIEDLSSKTIASAMNSLLENKELQFKMRENCKAAKEAYNWQNEEKKLLDFYNNIFAND